MTTSDRETLDRLTAAVNRLAAAEEAGNANRERQFEQLEKLATDYIKKQGKEPRAPKGE